MITTKPVCLSIALALWLLVNFPAFAAPWIKVGDTRLRNNLQLLNDSGVISVSLTTWPLMWADVDAALDGVETKVLSPRQLTAVRELKFEMDYQTSDSPRQSATLAGSNSRSGLREFSTTAPREQGEINYHLDWMGDWLSFRFESTLGTDPGDEAVQSRYDGSYVAGVLGDWVVGAGAVEQWWGPANRTSLILSNNARPIKAMFLRNRQTEAFETPWLSWMGPWQLVAFVGQLEEERHIPNARITGLRFTFKPFDQLEIGFSRAMQWGGEGRGNSFKDFWKALTVQSENTQEGAGNQLAGMDIRYNFQAFELPTAFYLQAIGEDESNLAPSKYVVHAGAETIWGLASEVGFVKTYLEFYETTADFISKANFNQAYNHSTYRSGYRYRQRSIGATFDNDSKIIEFGGIWQLIDGRLVGARIASADLNQDNLEGGNTLSVNQADAWLVGLSYQQYLFKGRLSLEASYLSEDLVSRQADIESLAASVAWEYRW